MGFFPPLPFVLEEYLHANGKTRASRECNLVPRVLIFPGTWMHLPGIVYDFLYIVLESYTQPFVFA